MFEAARHTTDHTQNHRPLHTRREATPRDATADTPCTVWVSDGDTPRDRDGISTDYTRYGVYRTQPHAAVCVVSTAKAAS